MKRTITMEIRKMNPDDVAQVAMLEAEIFSDPWSEKDIFSYVCTSGGMCYSAISDGRVVAYILGRVIAPEGEVYRIATRPGYRRRGIAYRLLDYAVKCERGRGLETLFLEVREGNIPARNLYHSYGFIEMGVRKNYYSNPTENAIVMTKANKADMIN